MKHRMTPYRMALTTTRLLLFTAFMFPAYGHSEAIKLINGDQYHGRVIRVDETQVVFESEIQGRLKLPRSKVAVIILQEQAAAALSKPKSDDSSTRDPEEEARETAVEGLDALRQGGDETSDAVTEVQQQFLKGASPEAIRQYRQMVSGLMGGSLSIEDIRQRAKESAEQIRRFRGEFEEAGPILDNYLGILESFVRDSAPPKGDTTAPKADEAKETKSEQPKDGSIDRSGTPNDERAKQD